MSRFKGFLKPGYCTEESIPGADSIMRAIWCVLLTVFLVASMAVADVEVYSDVAEKMLQFSDPYSSVTSAKLVNSNIEMGFRVRKPKEDDGEFIVLLPEPHLDPTLEDRSKVCGGYLGIQLNDTGPTICRLSSFVISGVYYQESHTYSMEFQLSFGLGTENPFTLNIPLFLIPPELASENKKDELKSWANKYHVGLHSPVNSQALSDIRAYKPVTLDFIWLNELLEFEIHKKNAGSLEDEINAITLSFVSRSIVLSKNLIDEISQVIPFLDE